MIEMSHVWKSHLLLGYLQAETDPASQNYLKSKTKLFVRHNRITMNENRVTNKKIRHNVAINNLINLLNECVCQSSHMNLHSQIMFSDHGRCVYVNSNKRGLTVYADVFVYLYSE